jgi:outer membrane protein
MNKRTPLTRWTRWTVLVTVLSVDGAGVIAQSLLSARSPQSPQSLLTLREALALAVQRSPEIAEALARERTAAWQAEGARALFQPSLSTSGGAQYTSGFPLAPGGNLPALFDLAYSQPLFNPSGRADARSAAARAEARRLSVAQVRAAVIQRTASLYLELVAIRRSLERQTSAAAGADQLVDAMLNQQAEGRALRIDVLRARLSVARARQQVVDLDGRAAVIEQQLRDATGADPGQPLQIALEDLPRAPDRTVDTLVAAAEANSPELRVVEAERRASQEHLAGQRQGYWPSVDLVGNYSVLGRFNNYDEFFRAFQRNNVNVGVQASVPILTPATRASMALARSELGEAEASVRARRAELALNVRRAAQQLRGSVGRRDIADLEAQLAEENIRVLQERAAEGRAPQVDLAKAQLDEAAAWTALFMAEYERQQADLQLRAETGDLDQLVP